MFDIFKKKEIENNKTSFIEVACLLIHASKIDEDYTINEKNIIKETLLSLGAKETEINSIITDAEKIEQDSNQILDFTKKLKNEDKETKLSLIEALWKIIFSNNIKDMYEANLMRRLTGLLYLDPRDVGDLKEKVRNSK
tara:strand:- start:102 stop:518 length:417 start_codon:yes stop_codon:yes gene_type:complete